MGEEERYMVVNPDGKRPPVNLGTEGVIILKFIVWKVELIDLAQVRCKWQAVVNSNKDPDFQHLANFLTR